MSLSEHRRAKMRECRAAWAARNPGYLKAWKERNPRKIREYQKAWAERNRHRRREIALRWERDNPDKVKANTQRQRAARMRRVPVWFGELDELVVIEAADLANRRSFMTGLAWDVDHIVPLQGRTVSGLHVWNNFQVILATVNRSKGNKYDHDPTGNRETEGSCAIRADQRESPKVQGMARES